MIKVRNLNCGILKNFSCDLQKNTVIFGLSGSGKSTLLRCVSGVNQYSGDIHCDEKIGMVFQESCLFPHWTVLENLMYPLQINTKISLDYCKQLAVELLNKFDMLNLADSYEVSGGQKQRVAILREMLLKRNLVLFDEPTSALDPLNTQLVVETINCIDFIIATHDLYLASKIGEYFIFMDNGEIAESGVDILKNPKSEQLKKFLI